MGPRSALSTRVLGLFLLGLASISSQSLYHLTLLLASLVLNAAFAFRRHFPSSQLTVDLCTVYVIAHLTLQFVAQVPFIRGYLTDTLSSILGIAKLYCPSKDEGLTCKEAFWSVYLGCFAEISLAVLLAWNRRASIIRVECNEEGYVRALRHFYLLTPVALISWALMFPSWLSFVWLLASWFIFSLIAERTHRISVAPFLISYASWMLSMPFYIMRYLDGYPLHSSTEACVRRFESSLDATWRPSSPLSQALAAHYDTFLSLALCVFAALNISVIGLLLLLLSLLIFISTPKICRATCCAASVLLALLWLLSFLSSAMQLPVLVFPKDCQRTFIIDRNTTQWIGFWPVQTWPIIVLLFMISMRSTFSVDKTQWLCEITRIDAEKASLIYGLILACSHEDIGGLLLLISILTLRALPRRRQALLWTAYSRLLLAFLVLQYVSALGTPHQFSKCFDQFWTDWPESIKRYFLLPSSVSSSPIIVADYILILLLLVQKDVFSRDSDHPGGDNTPLLDPYQPIPSMYKDFISTKGNLVAYVHSVVFLYSHWITLVVVVVCCMEGGSVFAFAYLITVFVLLWKGTELYAAQPFDRFIASWNYLVYYNLAVLAIKAFYLNTMCAFGWAVPCWLERVLGVYCAQSSCLLRSGSSAIWFDVLCFAALIFQLRVFNSYYFQHVIVDYRADRILGSSGSSAIWFDVLCFAALIFQLRVFNSYYFQHVIVDYRADRILGSRGAELLLEVKEREGRKSERRLHCNVSWIEMVVAEEDREMPVSCGPAPRSHEEIKRSGYYHQTSERFFPKWLGSYDSETDREQRSAPALNGTSDVPITTSDESTMVEKTVEVSVFVNLGPI
ncbi:Piezo-type mechanosensitive ion channel component 2 [Toxocara canis]|uniref:Piezo-type mechanosensitive ion channel component 2 n=1 Tax=Toxocara canis TaxID=6265 RepID=A0A0B2VM07_TOXCA|nr:Piezo-type mechanosensitive ion channel component 2 [Toxocara canis]